MALTVGELVGYLRLEDQQFHTGLDRAEQKMRGTQTRVETAGSKIGSALGTAGKAAATALTAAAAAGVALGVAAFKGGVSYNALQQSSRAALTTILKGAGAANAQMDKLDAFARNSPFAKQVFIRAQQQLLGFGMAADKVLPTLDAIQNAVAATGGSNQEIAEIADVLAKVTGTGKITAETLNQLGYRGIDAATIIGESMGKTGNEIRSQITKGSLDAGKAMDALVDGMQKRFGGAAANVKETWVGATDRIKGAWRDIGSRLAEPFVGHKGGGAAIEWVNKVADLMRALEKQVTPLVNVLLPRFGFVFDRITPTLDRAKRAVDGLKFDGLNDQLDRLGRYGPVLAGVASYIVALGTGVPVLQRLGLSINPVVAGLAALVLASPQMRAAGGELLRALSPLAPVAGDIARTLAGVLADAVTVVADLIVRAVPIVDSLVRSFTQADGPIDLVNAALHLLPPTITAATAVLGPAIDIVGTLARGFEALPGPIQTAIIAFAAMRLASGTFATHIGGPVTGAMRGFGEHMRMQATLAQMEGRKIGGVGAVISTGMVRGLAGGKAALSGLMGMLGGPWGIALAGAAIGLGIFAKKQAETKAHVEALRSSLEETTGAITDMTVATVAQKLESEGVAELYQRMGGNLADLAGAALGRREEMEAFNETLRRYRAEHERTFSVNEDALSGVTSLSHEQKVLGDEIGKVEGAIHGQNDAVAKAQGEHDRLAQMTGKTESAMSRADAALTILGDTTRGVDERVRALRDSMDLLNGEELNLRDATARVNEVLNRFRGEATDADDKTKAMAKSLVDAKGNIDLTSEAGQTLHRNLRDLSDATHKQAIEAYDLAAQNGDLAAAQEAARKVVATAREEFIKSRTAMGMSREAAEQLADSYGLLPEDVSTQIRLSGVPETERALDRVLERIRALPSTKDIALRIQTTGNVPLSHQIGVRIAQADGGIVQAANGLMREPMIVKGGAHGRGILWGEPETGWEAYISGKPGMESRNIGILTEAARRLGHAVIPGGGQREYASVSSAAPMSTAGPAGPMRIEGTLDLGNGLVGMVRGVIQSSPREVATAANSYNASRRS